MKIGGDCGGNTVTEPREWPNNAREARDQSAERIARALRLLNESLDANHNPYAARIQRELYEALRWLESAGAPTRPENL